MDDSCVIQVKPRDQHPIQHFRRTALTLVVRQIKAPTSDFDEGQRLTASDTGQSRGHEDVELVQGVAELHASPSSHTPLPHSASTCKHSDKHIPRQGKWTRKGHKHVCPSIMYDVHVEAGSPELASQPLLLWTVTLTETIVSKLGSGPVLS